MSALPQIADIRQRKREISLKKRTQEHERLIDRMERERAAKRKRQAKQAKKHGVANTGSVNAELDQRPRS